MSSLIRATNLWGYEELVRELGRDPLPLLARVRIPPAPERPDDSFVPWRSLARLTEISAAELDCPDFGLRLARWQGLEMLGPIAVIARNMRTVQQALGAVASYLYIHSPALELRQVESDSPARLRFEYRITEPPWQGIGQAYELSMANGLEILKLIAGSDARPLFMSFTHPQISEMQVYRRTFGCPVHFEQEWCGIEIAAELATRELDSADPQTLRLASEFLESRFPAEDLSMRQRVSELICRLLPTGQCRIETVSEALAMHPRTLQRHLEDEGSSYADLLAAERKALTQRYLSQPGLYLSQIAGLLGYAEQSSFNRACQRWFGTSPKQYRRHIQRRL